MDTKGIRRGGMNWETGTETHTLLMLRIKQITNGSMKASTGNSKHTVMTAMGRPPKGQGYMYTYGLNSCSLNSY